VKYAALLTLAPLVAACTGHFDDPSGPAVIQGPPPVSAGDGSSSPPLADAGAGPSGGQADASTTSPAPDSSASDSPSDAPATIDDSDASCETNVDSYGYTQCTCLPGPIATASAVASCSGFDCCVRYGPDSGLAAGFGNPSLSSGLCACYSSADIAAIRGSAVSCHDFANGGVGTIVSSCP
jgi:hypothetical protein